MASSYFDARGLKWKESVPHLLTSAGGSFLESDWSGYSGADTRPTYDELGRVRVTTLPDGQTVETAYDGWHRESFDQKSRKRRAEHDWAGRTVAVKEYTGTSSYTLYATTTYSYDVADQLLQVTDALNHVTSISYDWLGRKVGMVDPDMGVWSYEYDPIGTLKAQVDAKEQRIESTYDALNRLVRSWYSACWAHETIAAGVHRVSVYDLMELRCAIDVELKAAGLSAASWTNPEIVAGKDVAIRATHFTELRSSIQSLWTAAGMSTVPEFSAGAVVSGTRQVKDSDVKDLRKWLSQYEESNWGQTRRARVYNEYDSYDGTSQFGKGRRTGLWDGTGHGSFTYDKAGRLTREDRWIDGKQYTVQSTYDALNRVYQATLPDSEVLTNSYGISGLPTQLASSLGVNYVSGVEYNPLGLPKRYTVGSGTTAEARYTYLGPGLDTSGYPYGALKTIQLQKGTDPMLVNREMTYDQVGNVTRIVDSVNTETIDYGYDDLDRLTSASSPISESYSYNEIGNITAKNGQGYTYGDSAHVHAVTAFNGTSYGYDPNGGMVTRGSQSIRYDPRCKPLRVEDQTSVLCRFAYDGDGGRRKRVDQNGTVHYLGGYERNVGNGQDTSEVATKYYSALGRLLAFRKGATLRYAGVDHLGGTIRVADASFAAVDQMRYSPFGFARDAGTGINTDHRFTSQVEDASIGLYWYASRAYDPVLGRFTVPDVLVPDAGNPQSLNRYAYTVNNPLRFVDPSGHVYKPGEGDVEFEKRNGRWVKVVRRAEGGYLQTLKDRNADAMVVGPTTVIARGDLPQGTDVYRHEMAHVDQAQHYLSDWAWQMNYALLYVVTAVEYGVPNAYAMHPLERDASLRGTGGEFWHNGGIRPQPQGPSPIPIPRAPSHLAYLQYLQPQQPSSATPGAPSLSDPADPLAGQVEFSLPAEHAPGGVGVVDITASNPSGTPASGGDWVSPGGANAQADAEARRAAWERAGSPDYNRPTYDNVGDINGYVSVYQ